MDVIMNVMVVSLCSISKLFHWIIIFRKINGTILGARMVQQNANRQEVLEYVEGMLKELIALAKKTDHQMLVYMMDMALQEARESRRRRENVKW